MGNRTRRGRALAIAACGLCAGPATAHARPLLPDIEQLPPTTVGVTSDNAAAPRYLLAFDSRIANGRGSRIGPVIVRGHRAGTTDPMVADQVIVNSDGSELVRPGIGQLVFEVTPDHQHWHLKAFDRYELRRAFDLKRVRPDNKAGFCMPDHLFTPDYCASRKPSALTLQEGMGRGYVDLYTANLEGQNIDVTGVPPGRYELVHWVNADSSVCEASYTDNVSAATIRLWPAGYGRPPYLRLLNVHRRFSPPQVQPRPASCPWRADRSAPRLRAGVAPVQRARRAIAVTPRCSELCSLTVSARLRIGRRTVRLRTARASAAPGERVRLRVPLSRAQAGAAKRARLALARVKLRARDRMGNAARSVRQTVLLR
jgi:hypothetical protein